MSRAQPKSSLTDQHARSIAAAIAKGRPPALTPDLDLYLESSPREIFVAFEGVARHMPPGGNDDLPLVICFCCSSCSSTSATALPSPPHT